MYPTTHDDMGTSPFSGMRWYEVRTANINKEAILALVSTRYNSYMWHEAFGMWQGTAEPLLVITLIAGWPYADVEIRSLAEAIGALNKHNMVLLSKWGVRSEFVEIGERA